ncbi:phage tail protein [Hymenobacter arcticus]
MEPILGEIRAVGFNFAPYNWALCDGSLLQIRQNTALFSLLGITYGGDGQNTFGLPDLRGRAVVHVGQGPGLSRYTQGQVSGTENVTLNAPQMPTHTHGLGPDTRVAANNTTGNLPSPANNFLAGSGSISQYGEESDGTLMAPNLIAGTSSSAGGAEGHSNMMPYVVTNYIIATRGIFPQRP